LSPIVTSKLILSRQSAIDDKSAFYTASHATGDKLQWLEDATGVHLIDKEKLISSRVARDALAVLSIVVHFSDVKFRFVADNQLARRTRSKTSLPNIAFTAIGVPPTQTDLANDFKVALSFLDRVMATACVAESTNNAVFSYYFWDRRIAFRHMPFTVRT
jgi:hypothetical protein